MWYILWSHRGGDRNFRRVTVPYAKEQFPVCPSALIFKQSALRLESHVFIFSLYTLGNNDRRLLVPKTFMNIYVEQDFLGTTRDACFRIYDSVYVNGEENMNYKFKVHISVPRGWLSLLSIAYWLRLHQTTCRNNPEDVHLHIAALRTSNLIYKTLFTQNLHMCLWYTSVEHSHAQLQWLNIYRLEMES